MSILAGQPVKAVTDNNAFMSKTTDSIAVSKHSFQNVDAVSGGNVDNIQRNINQLASQLGVTPNDLYNALVTWASSVVGTGSSSAKAKIEALVLKFRDTIANGGHRHNGTDGEGAVISAYDLSNFNKFFAQINSSTFTGASGTSIIVTTNFSGKVAGGNATTAGVVTTGTYNNKLPIANLSTGTYIEDVGGQRVYGKLTESAGVWTLEFFTNEAGVETAHSLSSQDILFGYYEVYDQSLRPTFQSNPFEFGTLDVTADVVDATTSQRGVVSTGAQSFAGLKTLTDGAVFEDLIRLAQTNDAASTGSDQTLAPTNTFFAVTNGALVSVAGISGAGGNKLQFIQNKTGATLSLKHENVAASAADRIQTPTGLDMDWKDNQVFAFIYNTTASRWALAGDSGGSLFSLSAIGATPNANGASYNSGTGAFNLQPANASFGGVMTTGGQSFAGYKEFTDGLMVEEDFRLNISNDSASGSLAELTTNVNPVKRMTNASLVSIAGMVEPALNCRVQIIINNTGNAISIVNDEGTITAVRRILTGTGNNMDVANNAAVMLIYNYNASRWQVVGGSGGGGSRVSTTKTANYTITINDSVILANPTSGDITLTLPTASTATGKTFTVKRTHATANALKVTSAQNIDGATDNFIDNQYDFVNYYCDGSTYWIL